jgi:selenocysteine-specific elongation factor
MPGSIFKKLGVFLLPGAYRHEFVFVGGALPIDHSRFPQRTLFLDNSGSCEVVMRVIGTAGHVDHGKSTLVEAMTGTHPDRLKEEQAREMTIDLGFAWLKLLEEDRLPDAEEIGIVDVPGHRDFIENMLAGIGGIDAVLFVVAADEGVMPQTREHLAIVDLLQIQGGVVALTKIDMAQDSEWLDLVESDLRQVLQGTVLADAPLVRVSGRTGAGVQELIHAIGQVLAKSPPRPNRGKPRLPVDRVFTMPGFGTVVTGTLTDGSFQVGEEVAVLPAGRRGRIRGLQTHQQKTILATPGGRTAINISGINLDDVHRGDVIAHPGNFRPTRRIDVYFRQLPDVALPLKHNTEVKFFLGAAEIVARLRLLGIDSLLPGEEGWLQLELRDPVVAVRGDHYILRRPSPGETLGGGTVVDPHPKGRHKRFSDVVLTRLAALAGGTPEDLLQEAALQIGAGPLREVLSGADLSPEVLAQALMTVLAEGGLIPLEDGPLEPDSSTLVATRASWEQWEAGIPHAVADYLKNYPLRLGMPKEELRSRLGLAARLFNSLVGKLVQKGALAEAGPLLSLPGHEVRFSEDQDRRVKNLNQEFAANPYSPPSVKEAVEVVGEDVFTALVDLGRYKLVSPEVVFREEDYAHLQGQVQAMLQDHGTISVAEMRDRFQTSRKYALAFLEHMDERGITVRIGDVRKLRAGA